MLEQKQGQFCNLHEILHRVTPIYIYIYIHFRHKIFLLQVKCQNLSVFFEMIVVLFENLSSNEK